VKAVGKRLLVVSHPNVVTSNQEVYLELLHAGWDVTCVVPASWRDDYHPEGFEPEVLAGLEGRVRFLPVALPGEPQRHFYLTLPARLIRELRPDVAFLEQEPFSVPAFQWGSALGRARVPYGLQADENLDRPFPWPARVIRKILLPRARCIAARSPRAGKLAREWGATGYIGVVPHTVPRWEPTARRGDPRFTVGFAGRLVPEKGLHDLIGAVARLDGPVRLLVLGDGPLRTEVESASLPNGSVEVRTGLRSENMRDAYAEMDVLALPSRTTPTWAEQFGRVLVEALLCGRPVVGADSGEIPWVIRSTGGGLVFPEGDLAALAESLRRLQHSPEERESLAREGREAAVRQFSVQAAGRALDDLLQEAFLGRDGGFE